MQKTTSWTAKSVLTSLTSPSLKHQTSGNPQSISRYLNSTHFTVEMKSFLERISCYFKMKPQLQGATVTVPSNLIVLWPFPQKWLVIRLLWHDEWNIYNSIILLVVPPSHSLKSTIHHAEKIWHALVTCSWHVSDHTWESRGPFTALEKVAGWETY